MEGGPETTRVGGGRTAGLVAVVVAGALGTVFWIGISGRPPAPPPVPPRTAGAIAVSSATSARPLGSVATPGLAASPAPDPTRGPTGPGRSRNFFNVAATIGKLQYLAELEEVERNVLRATFQVPIPPPATYGQLELSQVWVTGSHDSWAPFATWEIRLEALTAVSGLEYVVLDGSYRPGSPRPNVPSIVNRGYDIVARAQSGVPVSTVVVEIRIASTQLEGDDGLIGSIVSGRDLSTR